MELNRKYAVGYVDGEAIKFLTENLDFTEDHQWARCYNGEVQALAEKDRLQTEHEVYNSENLKVIAIKIIAETIQN